MHGLITDRRYWYLLFLIGFLSAELTAQHIQEERVAFSHPVLNSIEEALITGEISREEAILQKFYFGYQPQKLDQRFIRDVDEPIKCMTPIFLEYYEIKPILNQTIILEIENMIMPKTTVSTASHISDSGNFVFYYDVEGNNAVPLDDFSGSGVPDYIEHAAFAADSSYRYQVEQLGFVDFLKEEPYEIFFRNFRFYGTTTASGSTTLITLHSSFERFPENSHPLGNQIGSLYVTIAHEIKHAIQYATNRWTGQAGSFDWIEMDATLMEETTFDDVNDYYHYIKTGFDSHTPNTRSIFGTPENSTPGAYWHVSWMLFFFEKHGGDFWVDVWNEFITDRDKPFFDAIISVTDRRGLIFEQEHINNHVWHMASGPVHSPMDYGFRERLYYPVPRFTHNLSVIPDSLNNQFLRSLAANYIDVLPSNVTLGQPLITLQSNSNGVGLGVIGYFRNGSTDVQFSVNPNTNTQSIQTTWSWSDLVDLNIAVVNTNRDADAVYDLSVSSRIPDEDAISQNYPNPFHPATNIEFSLTNTKNVRIDVYDRIGRKVSTLVDGRLGGGFHTITFDGTGLASGLYFYRIMTDQTRTTKKMILVN